MDKDIVSKHYEIINKHYPKMNLTQLGMLVATLGVLRASMGHEHAKSTIENYIHPNALMPEVRQCLDFLEREILGIKKSKIDIDYWKIGNRGSFRRDKDKSIRPHITRLKK